MDAEYSVELGAEDDVLDFPWSSPEHNLRYYDLKHQPDLLLYVSEATEYQELGRYLAIVNSPASELLTAKCDVWEEHELSEAEAIYDARVKVSSYIDHLFDGNGSGEDPRFSFERHEHFARRVIELLSRVPSISAAIEVIIRRCYYHLKDRDALAGYYWTIYLSGYGEDAMAARKRWAIALDLLQNVILQVSGEVRRGAM
ncbi:MAG TPA: hypothetical protein VFU86_05190 [Terriglobales bacterium]|nr:hypothetical protein [Terriglobales bacterium]